MATNSWSDYTLNIPGANSLFIKLRLMNDPSDTPNNRTNVKYQAYICAKTNVYAYGTYNMMNQTPVRLSINGADIYQGNISFDLRGKYEVLIKEGSVLISHDSDGQKVFPFLWSVDLRSTNSNYAVANLTGNYTLPAIARKSSATVSTDKILFGQAFILNIARSSSTYTHEVSYTIDSETELVASSVGNSVSITIPASKATGSSQTSYPLQIKVVTKNGSNVIGEQILNLSIEIDTNSKPVIRAVSAIETVASVTDVLKTEGMVLSTISRLRVGIKSVNLFNGSTLKSIHVRVKEYPKISVYGGNDILMPVLNFPLSGRKSFHLEYKAIDSRGLESDWFIGPEIISIAYEGPKLGIMLPSRTGGGTIVAIKRTWSVQSITTGSSTTERNTAKLRFYTRKKGAINWIENAGAGSTALSGTNSSANLSGTFLGDTIYEIKAVLSDKFNIVESNPIPVGTESLPMTWAPDKVAVGGVVDLKGATFQVIGDMSINGQTFTVSSEWISTGVSGVAYKIIGSQTIVKYEIVSNSARPINLGTLPQERVPFDMVVPCLCYPSHQGDRHINILNNGSMTLQAPAPGTPYRGQFIITL